MKKNFFKKLAFVLALAMVITSIAPAAVMTSSAAPAIVKSNGSTFSGTYATGKTFKVKLSGVTGEVKWKSSNKDVATVGLTSGTVKTWGAGEATITATVVKTGKTYKKVLKVYERATSFTTNYDEGISLKKGDTPVTIKTTLTPSNSTDDVTYVSSNKEVVTVGLRSGKVTPVKDGSATITVYSKTAKATSPNSSTTIKKEIKVTVGEVMETVTQTAVNEVEAIFNVAVTDVKATDFTITNNSTKVNYAVKEIKKDGNKVVITTYQNMNDAKEYTVKCGDATANFTATNGQVASISIDPITVQAETETSMTALLKDANGIIVETVKYGAANTNVTFTIETNDGYFIEDKLVMNEVGKTAKARAVYHTYKYDDNAQEIGVLDTGDVTITAIPKVVPTFTNQTYTIADKKPEDWAKVTTNAILPMDKLNAKIFVYFKNSKGEVAKEGYTLESSDQDKLLVTDKGDMSAEIVGLVEGTQYVLVKKDDVIVYSCPVVISKAGVAESVTINKTNLVLSKAVDEPGTIEVKTKDQYGYETAANSLTVECLATSKGSDLKNEVNTSGDKYFEVSGNKVIFKSKDLEAGSYTYKIKVNDNDKLTRSFVVTIKEPNPNASTSNKLLLTSKEIDTKYDGKTAKLTAKVAIYQGGVLAGYVTLDNTTKWTITRNGVSDTVTGDVVNGNLEIATISETTITTAASPATIVSKLPVGSYKITITHDGKDYNETFTVKDTETGLKAERNKMSVKVNKDDSDEAIKEAILTEGLKYTGIDAKDAYKNFYSWDITKTSSSYYIKSVTLYLDKGGKQVPVTASVNKTINIVK